MKATIVIANFYERNILFHELRPHLFTFSYNKKANCKKSRAKRIDMGWAGKQLIWHLRYLIFVYHAMCDVTEKILFIVCFTDHSFAAVKVLALHSIIWHIFKAK